ncbi:hypothetical protein P7K49_005858 [Saguinus oedipus]|uniref:Uncharacterized protein n=1 Tax=Saguinus oedipus TaxID=9490 RepID=A0ABQ9W0R7_SAGOE|nr:hypothetical protein P7K49_005858 [Saguinus oedipus]
MSRHGCCDYHPLMAVEEPPIRAAGQVETPDPLSVSLMGILEACRHRPASASSLERAVQLAQGTTSPEQLQVSTHQGRKPEWLGLHCGSSHGLGTSLKNSLRLEIFPQLQTCKPNTDLTERF